MAKSVTDLSRPIFSVRRWDSLEILIRRVEPSHICGAIQVTVPLTQASEFRFE
jgi:hypothetical protein